MASGNSARAQMLCQEGVSFNFLDLSEQCKGRKTAASGPEAKYVNAAICACFLSRDGQTSNGGKHYS